MAFFFYTLNTKVFAPAVSETEGAHMVELANNLLKAPNFWILVTSALFIWLMARYILEQVLQVFSNRKKLFIISSQVHETTILHRYRHRKIKSLSSSNTSTEENCDKSNEEGSSKDKKIQSISNNSTLKSNKSASQSKSAYANSTPEFVPLSASIQSAPPSPPHFKTPSRIVPTNYGSEIKLKLMTSEDKALRLSNLRELHMKYRPTISSTLNPVRRCELGQRSSVGVLSSRYLIDVKTDTGYSEDQRRNIIWAAGNRNEHALKLGS